MGREDERGRGATHVRAVRGRESSIFLVFTGQSMSRSLHYRGAVLRPWGRDISAFGIILASIVNLFLQSSGLHFAIAVIGVLVFTGLTANDTQRIKFRRGPRITPRPFTSANQRDHRSSSKSPSRSKHCCNSCARLRCSSAMRRRGTNRHHRK